MEDKSNWKISVVMSAYNAESYISEAIESILNQTFRNIEFIIINDGSKDKTIDIIKQYKKEDSRIIVIDQKNQGLTKSLNIGIKSATGNYIARQDADDISLPNRFENFVEYISKHGDIDLYSTPSYTIDENGKRLKLIPNYFRRNGFDQRMLNYSNSMIHGALIINASLAKEHKYNENYYCSQDFELYHRLMSHGYKISYDKNNVTYLLRKHSAAISVLRSDDQLNNFNQVFHDNNLTHYHHNLKNRLLFKLFDIKYFLS